MKDDICHYATKTIYSSRHGLPIRALYYCMHPDIVFRGECWLTRKDLGGCIDFLSHRKWVATMLGKARSERPPNVRDEKA